MYKSILLICLLLMFTNGFAQKPKKIKDPYLSSFRLVPTTEADPIPEFYMNDTEVSNKEYLETLTKIKKSGNNELYQALLPDTSVWKNNFGDPYVDHYLRYPGFSNFPVVGITFKQAMQYAEWLTIWYNQQSNRSFKKIVIEVPDEAQWELAARGGDSNAIFPWGTHSTQDASGNWLANFTRADQSNTTWDTVKGHRVLVSYLATKSPEAALITAFVREFAPNRYGLYNMAGNVEEIVRNSESPIHGLAKGGSYADPGHFLRIDTRSFYNLDEASSKRGFRLSMRVIEE